MGKKFLSLILIIVLFLTGCNAESSNQKNAWVEGSRTINFIPETREENNSTPLPAETIKKSEPEDYMLKVHFLDVGQANATIVQFQNIVFVVDGGNYADARDIINYIDNLEPDEVYAVIGTHQHEDHIGGLSKIVSKYQPRRAYEPLVPPSLTDELKPYEYFKKAVDANDVHLINPSQEEEIYSDSDNDFMFEIVFNGEGINSTDLNSYSIVSKVTFKGVSFLLTGDSTEEAEQVIIKQESEREEKKLNADVLLVGHHGSASSTSSSFLSLVNPKYAIISCEKRNQYGHPHTETLKKLQDKKVYRTDNDGTILAISDGKEIKFFTGCTGKYPLGNKGYDNTIKLPKEYFVKYGEKDDEEEIDEGKMKCNYICDSTSGLYHEEDCEQLVKNESLWIKPIDMDELAASGYKPCPECISD